VQGAKFEAGVPENAWNEALSEVGNLLADAPAGSAAIIASARQTNEELYLLRKLAAKLGALTDSIPRIAEADALLLNADRNPNSAGARLTGIAPSPLGGNLPKIAAGIRDGSIKTLLVFGEDVTQHGIGVDLLDRLETLIVSDILPNATTGRAHYLLPGCAHAEKRGSFVNAKGRVQRFVQNIQPKGQARAEWEFLHELARGLCGLEGVTGIAGLFNQMAAEVPAFRGLTWAALGDLGVMIKE
jgi:NADH-quinone oxidoreductase subunit G